MSQTVSNKEIIRRIHQTVRVLKSDPRVTRLGVHDTVIKQVHSDGTIETQWYQLIDTDDTIVIYDKSDERVGVGVHSVFCSAGNHAFVFDLRHYEFRPGMLTAFIDRKDAGLCYNPVNEV